MLRSPWALLGWLALAGCGSALPAAHVHTTAETVSVTERGLVPGNEVRIPVFASVVFRNARNQGAVDVELARRLGACQGCSTMLNFVAEGDLTVARKVAPLGIATICFHEVGSFAFVVRADGSELRGTVHVGGDR